MRGFVTLATGDVQYYELAKNLLISYRHNTKDPMPFAIVSDKENEYTALFDRVVILSDPTYSFLDKINMLYDPPFEENIFIDADCLAYGDLNDLWDYMPKHCGVVAPGRVLPKESDGGFFEYDSLGEYKNHVKYNVGMHGGIYFFRNDNLLKDQLKHIEYIYEHYSEYKFKYFTKPADEPLVALSTAIMGMKPVEFKEDFRAFAFYPSVKGIKSNVLKGELSYITDDGRRIENVYLLHWSHTNTRLPHYKIEIDRLSGNYNLMHCLTHHMKYNMGRLQNYILRQKRLQ